MKHRRVRDVPSLPRALFALFFVVLRASLLVRSLLSFLFAFRALPALFFFFSTGYLDLKHQGPSEKT